MVTIVGGGPAGCSAGYFLARNGYDKVTLYEKNPGQRKACGGGLSWRVMNQYKHFTKGLDFFPVKKAVFDIDGQVVITKFRKNVGVITDRLEFDKGMRRIAESEGVLIKRRFVKVDDIKDDYVFDATGCRAYKDPFVCVQSFARIRNPEFKLVFRRRINPLGYYWVFPISDECANIGMGGSVRGLKLGIDKAFQKINKEFGYVSKKLYASPIATSYKRSCLTYKNKNGVVFRLGESANLVNPITGEGIYYALRSGEVAAKSLNEKDPRESYDKEIHNWVNREFLISKFISRVWYQIPIPLIQKKLFLTLMGWLDKKAGLGML